MDKFFPRLPSKSETHAKVRCKAEGLVLKATQGELEKLSLTEIRHLKVERKKFVVDRRRSMGAVFNAEAEGAKPFLKSKSNRSVSDPEVLSIFQRQLDRRKSVQTLQTKMAVEVLRKLEEKYQEALHKSEESNYSDSDVTEESDLDDVPLCDDEIMPDAPSGAGVLSRVAGRDYTLLSLKGIPGSERKLNEDKAHVKLQKQGSIHEHFHPLHRKGEHPPKVASYLREENRNCDLTWKPEEDINTHDADLKKSATCLQPAVTVQHRANRERSHSDGNVTSTNTIFKARRKQVFLPALVMGDKKVASKELAKANGQEPLSGQRTSIVCNSKEMVKSNEQESLSGQRTAISYYSKDLITKESPQSPQESSQFDPISLDEKENLSCTGVTGALLCNAPFVLREQGPQHPARHVMQNGHNSVNPDKQHKNTFVHKSNDLQTPVLRYLHDKLSQTDHGGMNSSVARLKPLLSNHPNKSLQNTRKNNQVREEPTLPKGPLPVTPGKSGTNGSHGLRLDICYPDADVTSEKQRLSRDLFDDVTNSDFSKTLPKSWNTLMYELALDDDERKEIVKVKKKKLICSLLKRQTQLDNDVSRRIQAFLDCQKN